jgi:hypothetical protein
VRTRNFVVASSQPATGGRPTSPSSREATRPPTSPNRWASRWLRRSKAKTVMVAASPAMPTRAALIRRGEVLPRRASRARASTGRLSLTRLFHTPATSMAVVVRDRE